MSTFTNVEFMTAKEKLLVLKGWKTFIKGGFQKKHFTKRIYEHLHLNCSFIAHYSIHGFYETYFENPKDTTRFVSQFDSDKGYRSVELGMSYWMSGDYADLNQAMCEAMELYKKSIYERCQSQEKERDLARASALAKKHGLNLTQVT